MGLSVLSFRRGAKESVTTLIQPVKKSEWRAMSIGIVIAMDYHGAVINYEQYMILIHVVGNNQIICFTNANTHH